MEKINIITNLNDKGKRLDKFLSEIIEDATRSFVQKLINNNLVLINSKIITKAGTKLKGNESIEVNILEENQEILPEDIPINKIYEDDDIIIINKNPNMVVHPCVLGFILVFWGSWGSSWCSGVHPGVLGFILVFWR